MFKITLRAVGPGALMVVLALFLIALSVGVSAAFWGWLLMLVVGDFGLKWGYGRCFVVGIPLSLILGALSPSKG